MKNALVSLWRNSLGPVYFRLVGQRFVALEAHIDQAADAQYVELKGFAERLGMELHTLNANTLELSELLADVQQRLERREAHSDQIAETQRHINVRLEAIERSTADLSEALAALSARDSVEVERLPGRS